MYNIYAFPTRRLSSETVCTQILAFSILRDVLQLEEWEAPRSLPDLSWDSLLYCSANTQQQKPTKGCGHRECTKTRGMMGLNSPRVAKSKQLSTSHFALNLKPAWQHTENDDLFPVVYYVLAPQIRLPEKQLYFSGLDISS